MLLDGVNKMIEALSKSNVSLQFYLGRGLDKQDPFDYRTRILFKIRRSQDHKAYGRGIVLSGDKPNEGELEALFASIIATVEKIETEVPVS